MSILNSSFDKNIDNKELQQFKDSFLESYNALCSFAYRYVENTANAEDIVQEVYLDIWKKRKDLDFTIPLRPLLYKLTRNKSVDFLRSSYQKEIKLDDYTRTNSLEDYVINLIVNEDDQLHLQELTQAIQQCVEDLPEQCKKVYKLSRITELKNKEIAERLGVTVKAVEKHITKALLEIRNHLKEKDLLSFFLLFSSVSSCYF